MNRHQLHRACVRRAGRRLALAHLTRPKILHPSQEVGEAGAAARGPGSAARGPGAAAVARQRQQLGHVAARPSRLHVMACVGIVQRQRRLVAGAVEGRSQQLPDTHAAGHVAQRGERLDGVCYFLRLSCGRRRAQRGEERGGLGQRLAMWSLPAQAIQCLVAEVAQRRP